MHKARRWTILLLLALLVSTPSAYGQATHNKPYIVLELLPGTYCFDSPIEGRVKAYDTSNFELPNTAITITSGAQTLATGSGQYFNLPSGGLPIGKNSVTASATGLDSDSENAYLVKTVIKRNGTPITAPQNVTVGEMMHLSVELQGAPQGTMWGPSWSVPFAPTTVKDWTHSNTSSTRTNLELGDTKSNILNFAWVMGGGQTVSCRMGIPGSNEGCSSSVTFNVTRPNIGFTVNATGQMAFDYTYPGANQNNNEPSLHYGVPDIPAYPGAVPGVRWSFDNLPAGFIYRTDYQLIQLVSPQRSIRSGIGTRSLSTTNALDNGTDNTGKPNTGSAYPYTSDAPGDGTSQGDLEITLSESFQTWLMFKPPGVDSIWVPLRKANWSWSGHAQRNAGSQWIPSNVVGGGSLLSAAPATTTVGADDTEFPEWVSNIADQMYH